MNPAHASLLLVAVFISAHVCAGSSYHIPYFLPADDLSKQSFIRILWPAGECHYKSRPSITIRARDDEGNDYGPITVPWQERSSSAGKGGCGRSLVFNSNDLEKGDSATNLYPGVGDGQGAWQLFIESPKPLRIGSYVRTVDGFLTPISEVVPFYEDEEEGMAVFDRDWLGQIEFYKIRGIHRVLTFNPGRNRNQRSFLRLINPNDEEIGVGIFGRGDHMVELKDIGPYVRIGPRKSIHISVQEMEEGRPEWVNEQLGYEDGRLGGDEGLQAYGPVVGKWRLGLHSALADDPQSVRPLVAMNLMSTPTGHITNLSHFIGVPAEKDDSEEDGFDIQFIFGDNVTPAVRESFERAADRWTQVITGDLPDIHSYYFSANGCQNKHSDSHAIDDMLVFVKLAPLGMNGPIGRANTCAVVENSGGLKNRPIAGWIIVNNSFSDWSTVSSHAEAVFAHEIGHTLGFVEEVIEASGHVRGSEFIGLQAVEAFQRQGARGRSSVPMTPDLTHWAEDLSGELMYGGVGKNSPISQITVGLLADLGYKVDFSKAEFWYRNVFP